LRILIAEDEYRMAELIADALRQEGHSIEVAHDGSLAVEMALAAPFDLILLDVMLPGLDGFSVCRRLRESQKPAAVLMLTARGAIEDRVSGLDAGADDYLVKPFAMAELRARVRALSRRPFAMRGPELHVGDLVLNLFRYEASRGGRRLDLTAREFQLLALLMRRAGEALSRAEILDSIWGEQVDPYTNVVDQYIFYLRAKTEQYGPRLIETVRGVGYMIRDPLEAENICSAPPV
jgi:two-component system, OmpR family, response regulator